MVADRGYRRWAGAMLHGKPHCDRGAQYAFDKLGWLQFEQLAAGLLELEAERRPDDCSPATEEPTLRALECIARLAPEYRSVPQTVARQLRRSAVERGDAPLLRPGTAISASSSRCAFARACGISTLIFPVDIPAPGDEEHV